jgi:hypothetical protein
VTLRILKMAKKTSHRRRHGPRRPPDATSVLEARHAARFTSLHLREPFLQFGGNQQAVDPKAGLSLFGPEDLNRTDRRTLVRVGVIGTGDLIDLTRAWVERSRTKISPMRKVTDDDGNPYFKAMDPRVYTPFPGLKTAFRAEFLLNEDLILTLTQQDTLLVERAKTFEQRVKLLVDAVVQKLTVLADKTTSPDVVVIALPTRLRKLVTVPSRQLHDAAPRAKRPKPQASLLELLAETSDDSALQDPQPAVFHHSLKARAMAVGIPTQLIWQQTLEGQALEDEATRAWNFWTSVYYKGGGTPWRVVGLAKGTCYVGLAFYKDRKDGTLRSCLAQAFSDHGEGLVLRSEAFKWMGSKSPHLPKDVASGLIVRVLEAYKAHVGHPPSRVVVHKWQRYRAEERAGFEEALSQVGSFDLVAFSDRGIRFFRAGQHPPLRGTLIQVARGNSILFTRGFIPYLGEYPGMRVPRPLEIVEHFGSASMSQLAAEILALTKMDWNSAMFAGKEPITTAFSEDVGHILAELPVGAEPRPQYRFYM